MSKNFGASCARFLADLINSSSSLHTFALLDGSFTPLRLKIYKLCWLNLQVLKDALLPKDRRIFSAFIYRIYV